MAIHWTWPAPGSSPIWTNSYGTMRVTDPTWSTVAPSGFSLEHTPPTVWTITWNGCPTTILAGTSIVLGDGIKFAITRTDSGLSAPLSRHAVSPRRVAPVRNTFPPNLVHERWKTFIRDSFI